MAKMLKQKAALNCSFHVCVSPLWLILPGRWMHLFLMTPWPHCEMNEQQTLDVRGQQLLFVDVFPKETLAFHF